MKPTLPRVESREDGLGEGQWPEIYLLAPAVLQVLEIIFTLLTLSVFCDPLLGLPELALDEAAPVPPAVVPLTWISWPT